MKDNPEVNLKLILDNSLKPSDLVQITSSPHG
jgi:hypothetical protein